MGSFISTLHAAFNGVHLTALTGNEKVFLKTFKTYIFILGVNLPYWRKFKKHFLNIVQHSKYIMNAALKGNKININ